jgi:hypothetical protein
MTISAISVLSSIKGFRSISCGASKKYKILDNQILNPIQLPISPPLFSVSIFNGAISVDENA